MPFNIDPEKQCPELTLKLPKQHNIFLSFKENKKIKGFLIEDCPLWQRLEKSFEKYFLEEVLFSAKRYVRETTEPTGLLKSRILYFNVFKEILENATVFDSGRDFLKIFLLAHLKQYKKLLPEVPSILSSVIPNFPSVKAEELKLKIFYGLCQEIADILSKKESKTLEFWKEILSAPQYFLEKEFSIPQNFPWAFGEIFYEIPSEKIKRHLSDAIIQTKDFVNSREGKKIILSFFKREISIEEAICSDEILDLLSFSDETLNFMKKLSLNLRYGEIFKSYMESIYFCKKVEDNYYLNDLKLEEDIKPLQFSLVGVVNPAIFRYFFLLRIINMSELLNKMVLMDTKSYGNFLKEKEKFETSVSEEAEKFSVFFEKYINNGILFSSRNPKNLFDFVLEIFFNLTSKTNAFLDFNNLACFLGKGSFYLLPYYYPNNETKYEIIGNVLQEGLNLIENTKVNTPFVLISHPFLETLSQNIEVKNLEIFKAGEDISLKIGYKNYNFLISPLNDTTAVLKAKREGEVIKTLDPNFSTFKITELLSNLKDLKP